MMKVWLSLKPSQSQIVIVARHSKGEKADEAKMRASNIARLMQYKIESKGGSDLLT